MGFESKTSAFDKDFKTRGAIAKTEQKDRVSYVRFLKQEVKDKGYWDKEIVNAVIKAFFGIISSKVFENCWQFDFEQIDRVTPIKFCWGKYAENLSQYLVYLIQG